MDMQMYKLFLFRHIPFVCHIYGKGTEPLCKKVAKVREYPKYDYNKILLINELGNNKSSRRFNNL